MKKSLFTFIRNDDDGQCTIASILATDYFTALEICKRSFNPTTYHEIPGSLIDSLNESPTPGIIIANNDDLKEV